MNQWQPIETAPKDGTTIIIGWRDEKAWQQRMGAWDSEHSFKWNDETDESESEGAWSDGAVDDWAYQETYSYPATHWMPCPEPPTE